MSVQPTRPIGTPEIPNPIDGSYFSSLKTTLETPEFGSLRFNFHPLLAGIQAIRSALFD
jgi:hypothetical protein